jgi:hypothetical protein
LVDRFNLTADDARSEHNEALQASCSNGHLEVAKWLVERFHLTVADVRSDNNCALLFSCSNGHLEVVKWLVERFHLTVADVRSDNNYALRSSCVNGHLEVAKWLIERFDLDTSVLTENQLTNLKRWITGIQCFQRLFFVTKTSSIQRIVIKWYKPERICNKTNERK